MNRIQEIKERLQKVTPGEWNVCFAEDEAFNPDFPEEDPCVVTDDGQFVAQVTYDGLSDTCRPTMYADAEFIAHAKDDIAFLLGQLEEMIMMYQAEWDNRIGYAEGVIAMNTKPPHPAERREGA